MKHALLLLDLLNEIIHPEGEFGKLGYAEEAKRKNVVQHTKKMLNLAREHGIPVIHVVVGFDPNYVNCPQSSEVFKMVRNKNIMQFNTWSTQIVDELTPTPDEFVIQKSRVNPFYQTNLALTLSSLEVDSLVICGVSTEFVVLAAALSAHDKDYHVTVLKDAVSAISQEKDEYALNILASTAEVTLVDEFISMYLS